MRRMLKVSRSKYYEWSASPAFVRDEDDAHLIQVLRQIHAASRGTYDVRRVHAALVLGRGDGAGHGRIERLMRRSTCAPMLDFNPLSTLGTPVDILFDQATPAHSTNWLENERRYGDRWMVNSNGM